MKSVSLVAVSGLAMLLASCTTSSKVQEMINTSNRKIIQRTEQQEKIVRQLELSVENSGAVLKELTKVLEQDRSRLAHIEDALEKSHGYAEQAKVMSAENMVKVANLQDELRTAVKDFNTVADQLVRVDRLYESAMMKHYQAMIESANAAVEALKAEGWGSTTNSPAALDEPMEIFAPDTFNLVPAK
ncbi:MAG TPA: hypothetical protein VIR63_00820 [Pontiella sp.]